MKKVILVGGVLVLLAGIVGFWFVSNTKIPTAAPSVPAPVETMCTMDALQCPDGSYVGRTGPHCEFICPELPAVPTDVQATIVAKADLIVLEHPVPLGLIENGVTVAGRARGNWYFEGSFPIELVNASGTVIAQGVATAEGEWMTTEFVPFTTTLEFQNPYTEGAAEALKQGILRLKRDNPSGMPEHDDSLDIPVRFAR